MIFIQVNGQECDRANKKVRHKSTSKSVLSLRVCVRFLLVVFCRLFFFHSCTVWLLMRIKSLQQKRLLFITLVSTHSRVLRQERDPETTNRRPHPQSLSPLFHYWFLFTAGVSLHNTPLSGSRGGISVFESA